MPATRGSKKDSGRAITSPMEAVCVPDMQNNREGPLAREPSKYLNGQRYKDWPKRHFDCQLQEARKRIDRVITLVREAIRVPTHLAPPGSLQGKLLSHLHA